MGELFLPGPRADRSARAFNEPLYAFVDRSGQPFFAEIRRLLIEWLSHVPPPDPTDLRRRLQSKDDALFESAFWEVFLHEAYLRSGYSITIHPAVTGTSRRPDFLVEGDGTRFYVEAVRACAPPDRTGQARRLEEVRRVLATVSADRYILDMATYAIGARPLDVRGLRRDLRKWLSDLDGQAGGLRAGEGSRALARLSWRHEGGWRLEFTAQPIRSDHVGAGLPLVRAHLSMGWAHDASRILTALDHKANRYGVLDAPLLIAVLNNPEFHADDLDVERALFGAMIDHRPGPEPPKPGQLIESGHWCTGKGWRRGHIPHVIVAQDLYPWTVTLAQSRLWTTLEPGICPPAQPGWLVPVHVSGPAPALGPADSLADLFGLSADWLAEEPRFASSPRTAAL